MGGSYRVSRTKAKERALTYLSLAQILRQNALGPRTMGTERLAIGRRKATGNGVE